MSRTKIASPPRKDDRPPLAAIANLDLRPCYWLAGAFWLMLLAGFVVLRLPGATIRGNEMSVERAVFTVINAASLTGFQQAVALDEYGASGQICVMALTVGGTLFALIAGGILVARAIRLPYTSNQIVLATLWTYVMAVGIGAAMLVEPGRSLIAAASQSASAIGNSGLFLGRLPGVADWRTHLGLMPLALIGGWSIPVIMELADLLFQKRKLSLHASTVLTLSAVLYLLGLIALVPWHDLFTHGDSAVAAAMGGGSAMSLNSRTAGFPLVVIGQMARPAQWLLILLMMIGAAPGGTGGGMKVTALFHLVRGVRRSLGREPGLRITGIAAVWVVAYLAIALATLMGLLATLPELPADRLVLLAFSAVGTVGLSNDPVSITGPGLMVLSAAMLLGRIAPLLVLWWTVRTCDDADVAVG
jgi:trk system potassium uptake protein TrkH